MGIYEIIQPDAYICLADYEYCQGNFRFHPIQKNEIEMIRNWRNSQTEILRQNNIISRDEQEMYFRDFVFVEYKKEKPNLILFSIHESGNFIAYGGLVHIDWLENNAELSFLMSNEKVLNSEIYKDTIKNFITFMKYIAFEELNLSKIFTETYPERRFHINCLEKNGFIPNVSKPTFFKDIVTKNDSVFHSIGKYSSLSL